MDTEMDEDANSLEVGTEEPDVPCPHPEPRITNRAQGGVRSDKTRFIRPVERQRMRPWLIDHLDKNDIPGLVWQDRAEKIFRISWKHAANQCFNMQKDTNLFERWAIHTGRHQDSDHKRWKANFRCALNSLPDVTEMKEQGVKKGNNAFKVYRFLNEKEAKVGKDGKPRKKREPQDLIYREETELRKLQDDFRPFTALEVQQGQGSTFEIEIVDGASGTSLPDLHQLVPGPSGVDLLLEADSKDKPQPVSGGMDNLQEILAAATASLAAGSDAQALEKISIEQLSRLGEVSRMKLDIRQSDRKRRKKEVSGILNVFLCNWCEKVFPTKTDLFQHFLVIHQDKLLSGEEYGVRKPAEHSEKLQQEIEDLEKKVLGFTQETYQPKDSEEVIEDGQVVDLSSNNSMTSQDVYIEDQVLDLSVAGALARVPQPQLDVALDLSISTSNKQKGGQKNGTPKTVQKRRRSSTNDVNYNAKFGNYGLAGAPQTKRQLSLLLKKKEEEEEKQRKQAEAQHSMEDIVHAEILMSLKSGSKDENETENAERETESENVISDGSDTGIKDKVDKDESKMNGLTDSKPSEIRAEGESDKLEKMDDQVVVEEIIDSSENVLYFELKDGSKVTVSEQIETTQSEIQTGADEVHVFVESSGDADSETAVRYDEKGSSGKPYKCALCVERFEDPTELLKHVSIHKTEYTCSVCMKVMTDKNIYLNHIESHLPHVKYKEKVSSETAGKRFTNPSVDTGLNKGSGVSKGNLSKAGDKKLINEKGAANAKETEEQNVQDKRNDSNKIIENTGQKNLQGEPAVDPAAGSGNLTGLLDSTKRDGGKTNTNSEKKVNLPRKVLKEESFELAVDCLQKPNKLSNMKSNVRNDVVDGEQMESLKNSKAESFALERYSNNFDHPYRGETPNKSEMKDDATEGKKDVFPVVDTKQLIGNDKGTKNEGCESVKQLGNAISKCEICSETFMTAVELNAHMPLHKETIEDRVRKNVFHCGLCDRELHIDDVQEHLQSHKSGQRETKNVQLNYDCPCMICDQVVPVKRFFSHLKSHSVYELSQAQNLLPAETSAERKEWVEGKETLVCNLCNFKFETFSDLQNHVKTHLGKKSLSCNLCNLKFETFLDLKNHVKTHLGPRNIKKEDAGYSVLEVKPTVLNLRQYMKKLPVKGEKRKVADEKRITGKRPKQKMNIRTKISKVKQKTNVRNGKECCTNDNSERPGKGVAEVKTETSSVIAAALKTGPKYSTNVLGVGSSKTGSFNDLKDKLGEGVTSEMKPNTDFDTAVSKFVTLEKFDILNSEETMKGDKVLKQFNESKRKIKSEQLGSSSQKRQKITVEEVESNGSHGKNAILSELAESSTVMNDRKHSTAVEEVEARTIINDKGQNLPQVERTEVTSQNVSKIVSERSSIGSNVPLLDTESLQQTAILLQQGASKLVSVDPLEKNLGPPFDSSILGTNVLPSVLRTLQQKILLVKQGTLTVATPFFGPSPVINVTTHQQEPLSLCSSNSNTTVSALATVTPVKSSANTICNAAVSVESLRSAFPVNIVKNKFNQGSCSSTPASSTSQQIRITSPQPTLGIKQLEASQKLLLAAANVSVTTPVINVHSPSLVTNLSSPSCTISSQVSQPLSALPVANPLNVASGVNVPQLLSAVSTLCKSQASVVEIPKNSEELRASVPDASVSQLAFSSPALQYSVGSLQKQFGFIPAGLLPANTSVTQVSEKCSVLGHSTVINNTANTASTVSTILKSQQQLSMMKLNLANQPLVYKPVPASVLPTQGNLQHAVPSVHRFLNANTNVPKPHIEMGNDTSKLSGFQLVWLPVNQVQNAAALTANLPEHNQIGIIAPTSSAHGIAPENQESASLPLTTSKECVSVPKSIQPNIGHLSSIFSSAQTVLQTSEPKLCQLSSTQMSTSEGDSKPVSSLKTKEITCNNTSSTTIPAVQNLEAVTCVSNVSTLQSSVMMPPVLSSSTSLSLPGITSAPIKHDSNLILACGICKQALGTLEQMNSHVCRLPAVNLTGQKFVTLTRLTKPSSTAPSPVCSLMSVSASGLASSPLPATSQPMKVIVIPATNSVPVSRGSSLSHPSLPTVNLAAASKAATVSVAVETPTMSKSVVTPGLHLNTQVVSKLLASKMYTSKSGQMNTPETSTLDAGIVLQRSENPQYVYFLPTRSTECGTVSTKAVVNTVNATPMKVQTSCISESVLNPELMSTSRKTIDKAEYSVSLFSEPPRAVASQTTEELPPGVDEKCTTASIQQSVPLVALPQPLSAVGQKLRAKALSNLYGTSESSTITHIQQSVPNVAMQKSLSVVGQKLRAKALSNLYGTPECSLKENSKGDIDSTENSEICTEVIADATVLARPSCDIQITKENVSSVSRSVPFTDQIITLYPCVICKQTFTFDQFMKHTKKHLTTSVESLCQDSKNVCTKPEDRITSNAKLTEAVEKIPVDKSVSKKENLESLLLSDIYRCHLCFSFHDSESSLSKHYRSAHPSMTVRLCPADNCAQLFIKMQEVDLHYASKHQHECRLCIQRFRTYVEFQAHVKQHYLSKRLKYLVCSKCGNYFTSRKAFFCHCRLAVLNKCPGLYVEKYIECQQCHCCSVNFTSSEGLKLHFKRKWYRKITYRCWICTEMLLPEEMTKHMTKHMPFTDQDCCISFCHTCCIVFPDSVTLSEHTALSSHRQTDTTDTNLLAKFASKKNSFLKAAELELPSKHGQSEMSKVKPRSLKRFPKGGADDTNENEVAKIMALQNASTCKQCNTCFSTLFDLKQHKVIRHSKVWKSESTRAFTKSRNNRCGTYSRRYFEQNRTAVCAFCGKRFFSISLLRQHIDLFHEEKTYFACKNPECDKNFNSVFESEAHVCESLSNRTEEAENSTVFVDIVQPSFKNMKEYVLQYYVEDCRQLLDKVANTVESVQEHLGDHFLCQYCSKRFAFCDQLKSHMLVQHAGILAQCVDCQEYFFHETTLLEHRRECAVKAFSDEDFHTKKKVLGCDVCLDSFIHVLGLTKYLRDVKFLSEKNKSSVSKCMTRKGVLDLKSEGEEEKSITFNNSRKFVCVSCKNEYCNAEDFYICMKTRLATEKVDETNRDVKIEEKSDEGDEKTSLKLEKSVVDLQNIFFCHDCEAFVCYEEGGMCAASLKHPCDGMNSHSFVFPKVSKLRH